MAMKPGTGRIQNRVRRYLISKNGEPVHVHELRHIAYEMFGDTSNWIWAIHRALKHCAVRANPPHRRWWKPNADLMKRIKGGNVSSERY
jgi:hypothetical protein